MFGNIFRKSETQGKDIIVCSPVKGVTCPLSEVNDPVFSDKILGDGVAVKPSCGRIVSPVDGTVALLFETLHAVNLITDQGMEVLVHVGLDTVNLKGKHFKAFVKKGDKVKTGDLLLEFDLEEMKAEGYDPITPVLICNRADYSEFLPVTGKTVEEAEKILTVRK